MLTVIYKQKQNLKHRTKMCKPYPRSKSNLTVFGTWVNAVCILTHVCLCRKQSWVTVRKWSHHQTTGGSASRQGIWTGSDSMTSTSWLCSGRAASARWEKIDAPVVFYLLDCFYLFVLWWLWLLASPPVAGDAGWDEVYGGAVRYKDPEERCRDPRRRRRMYDGGEESLGPERQTALPHAAPLLLPDSGV